jgi:Domain of unknown function (DUF4105)
MSIADKVRRLSVVFLLSALASCLAQAAPVRVGVMTMQPGGIFWERFGHNAIVVDDGERMTSYNFGFFDPSEDGFALNFLRGRMYYLLAALPLEQDLSYYRRAGRGVSIQWLDLDEAQREGIAERLAYLARPENARYRYDYFTNNCATQVRDVVDEALSGRLQTTLTASSLGNTYRSETVRLAWPARWMAIGFDLGLNAKADAALSRWQDAFIPMLLQQSLAEFQLPDGRPLVRETEILLADQRVPPPAELPQWSLAAMGIGIALGAAFFYAGRKHPKAFNAMALAYGGLCGLIGTALLLIWIGTDHRFGHGNANLLLFSPLSWLALALYAIRHRSSVGQRAFTLTISVLAGMAVLAVALNLLDTGSQRNLNWILMALPAHWAISRTLLRQTAPKALSK